MREDDSLVEELQQEETNPVEEVIEEVQETDAEIVPETETQPQDEVSEDSPETEERQEESGEDVPAEDGATEEEPATEEEMPAIPESKEIPYHERYYLKYREGKRSTPLNLERTKAFLQELGFDGGELRQAREGKNCAEGYRNADKKKTIKCIVPTAAQRSPVWNSSVCRMAVYVVPLAAALW